MTDIRISAEGSNAPRLSARSGIAPGVVIVLLMSLLATAYLGNAVSPEKHLHGFPIAMVNQDDGDTLGGKPTKVGTQITEAFQREVPAEEIDLQVVGVDEAQRLLRSGKV
ncbi:hypothetical protein [Nocardia asteroides]|uniref:hypothetical protein n=1 Tax=Nocardia asteroides TaxID=1824 RepID=UPI0033D31B2A